MGSKLMKMDAGDVKRASDAFMIEPEHIVVDDEVNAREVKHTPESTAALAAAIIADGGQLEPGMCRRIDGKKVHLVFGHGRLLAIKYINERNLTAAPMRFWTMVRDLTEKEAFLLSISENLNRNELTPLDIAYQQRTLRDRYQMTEEEIAKVYEHTQAYVCTLRKTFGLADEVIAEVKKDNLGLTTVIQGDLPDLPVAEQREILAEVKQEAIAEAVANGKAPEDAKLNAQKVNDKARNKKNAKGEKGSSRTMKNVREFLESMSGPAESERVKNLCKQLEKFINGSIGGDLLARRFREIVNGSAEAA